MAAPVSMPKLSLIKTVNPEFLLLHSSESECYIVSFMLDTVEGSGPLFLLIYENAFSNIITFQ